MNSSLIFYKSLGNNLRKSHMNKPQIIAKTVIDFINAGVFKIGDPVPSIHKVSTYCNIAGETVRQAYNSLKQKGMLDSKRGRAYYVISDKYEEIPNVFLMFNFFGTPHKVETLNGILAGTKDKAKINYYSHYKNPDIFVKTLQEAKGKYDYYVVMPLRDPKCAKALEDFDQSKLLLIDIDIDYPNKSCPKIIQNFNENFLKILDTLKPDIKKYEDFELTMVLNNAPEEHQIAFETFCTREKLRGKVLRDIDPNMVEKNKLWIVFNDADLVTVIKTSNEKNLQIRKDYALISYNDIPMKHIIDGGITTISIDFFDLGKRVAKQILNWDCNHSETVETFLIRGNTI